jgi:hypothetical protein
MKYDSFPYCRTEISWIDPPFINGGIILGEKQENRDYCKFIDNYLCIKKKGQFLGARIDALAELAQLLGQSETDSRILAVANSCRRKANYLSVLFEYYKNGILTPGPEVYDFTSVNPYFTKFDSPHWQPLYLYNSSFFDVDAGYLRGEYWLETIDPCHRQLEYYKLIWQNSYNDTPFFLWLDTINIPPQYRYTIFTADNTEKKLFIQGGRIKDFSGAELNCDNSCEFIFIIDQNMDIYGCYSNKSISHVSLSLGKALVAAGSMKVTHGILTYLNVSSGHYMPQNKEQLLSVLRENELIINNITIGYYQNGSLNEYHEECIE